MTRALPTLQVFLLSSGAAFVSSCVPRLVRSTAGRDWPGTSLQDTGRLARVDPFTSQIEAANLRGHGLPAPNNAPDPEPAIAAGLPCLAWGILGCALVLPGARQTSSPTRASASPVGRSLVYRLKAPSLPILHTRSSLSHRLAIPSQLAVNHCFFVLPSYTGTVDHLTRSSTPHPPTTTPWLRPFRVVSTSSNKPSAAHMLICQSNSASSCGCKPSQPCLAVEGHHSHIKCHAPCRTQ